MLLHPLQEPLLLSQDDKRCHSKLLLPQQLNSCLGVFSSLNNGVVECPTGSGNSHIVFGIYGTQIPCDTVEQLTCETLPRLRWMQQGSTIV